MIEFQAIGLGTLIEMILSFFGIHPWTGCGCEQRKERWDSIIVYLPVLR